MVGSEGCNLPADYYRHIRADIAEYIVRGSHHILDVGCGAGVLGAYLKQQGCASEVVGIEIDTIIAKEASTKLDCVLCANLNQTSVVDVLKAFDKASFDYIVCADVLEHLIDPREVLAELVAYLKPNGRLVTSIPNVRHWSVWLPLILRGQWEYCESGIMDSTHLRFFTRCSAATLLSGAGLNIVAYKTLMGGKWRNLDKYTFGLLTEFISIQLVFVGVKREKDG